MKKLHKLFYLFATIGIVTLSTSCQGPPGVAGEDGVDGTNGNDGTSGNVTCMTCHNSSTDFTIKQIQFDESAHAVGTYYSRSGECSGCHSTEGFLARQEFESINDIYELSEPIQTPISCRTCHKVHYAYAESDWDLTFTDPVNESLFGTKSPEHASYEFGDLGNSNQCVQCHQARDRGNIPAADATTEVTTGTTHWGPHYGVQGNVLIGKAGVHVGDIPTSTGHKLTNACIACHMSNGSHTLETDFEVCASCHTSADNAESMLANLQTTVHDKLFELGALLEAKGVMTENIEDGELTGYTPVNETISADEAKALWNYMVVYQDHSYGLHNPSYIKALLDNSIELME